MSISFITSWFIEYSICVAFEVKFSSQTISSEMALIVARERFSTLLTSISFGIWKYIFAVNYFSQIILGHCVRLAPTV